MLDSVNITYKTKVDSMNGQPVIDPLTGKKVLVANRSTYLQSAIKYQGVALPFGSKYINYQYKVQSIFLVNMVARNTDGNAINQAIQQKKLIVK